MDGTWPRASYFNDGTAAARHAMAELEFVERADGYELHRRKADGSYWRLDASDKHQQRFLVWIEQREGWATFDSAPLEKQLLLDRRGGLGTGTCAQQGCDGATILGSAFCLDHTYERGVRK